MSYAGELVASLQNQNDISKYADNGPVVMYSFSRPAHLFYSGVVTQLEKNGYSREQATEILKDKAVRWGLDAFEDEIVALGRKFAKKHLIEKGE